MFLLNGQPLAVDIPFTADDIQYPANWLRLSSQEEREAIGITEVQDQVRPDDRFYWVSENGDGTFTATPKDIDQLKSEMIVKIKQAAGSMLSQTDWKIIRAAEGGQAADSTTLNTRAAIRQASNMNETAVNACTTVEQLADLTFFWPEVS